jgi:hypothetical protein
MGGNEQAPVIITNQQQEVMQMTTEGRQPMDDVISSLRTAVVALETRRDELREQANKADVEFKRAERALKTLLGQPSGLGRKPNSERSRVRPVPSGLSEERIAEVKVAILRFVRERDVEEFRQVDIRSMAGVSDAVGRSNVMANGFRILREEGFLRLSRQDGNNKWFRLTREALAQVGMNGDGS